MFIALIGLAGQLWASGWPPFAFRDTINVVRGGSADTLADGNDSVLDNDFDFENDTLRAFLVQNVSRGSLQLFEDGTFIYVHDGSGGSGDSFTYRAFDGTGFSGLAQVTINIEDRPNTPPSVIGSVPDQEAFDSVPYRLELAGLFADPDDGDTLRFSASGLPNSNSLSIDPNTGVLSGTPRQSDVRNRSYNVVVTATDRAGASASLSFRLTILAQRRADLALDVDPVVNPVQVGQSQRWQFKITNRGPGNAESALLDASWSTSGPTLSLSSGGPCSISNNGSQNPGISCAIGLIPAGQTLAIDVDAVLNGAGDSTVISVLEADDPDLSNNDDLSSAQVVEAVSEGPTQVISISGKGIDAGDLNGDGETDVVVTDGETLVFFNNGNRSMNTPGTSLGAGTGGTDVAMLDWNADGTTDIAIGGVASTAVEIHANDGNGNFERIERFNVGSIGNVNDIAAADFNGDGRSDLVLAGTSGTTILLSRAGGGATRLAVASGAGLDVTTVDVEPDGDEDIIVVRQLNRRVDLHLNNGSGAVFTRVRRYYGSARTVRSDDLNEDGAPDLIVGLDGADLSAPETRVYYQQGNGDFAAGESFGAAPVTALMSGDVDLDGRIDVVVVNEAGVHQVYLGSGGSGFQLAPEQIVSDGMQRGVLTDFNSDQSLDLIMVGPDAKVLEIHANNGIGRLGLGDRVAPNLQLIGEAVVDIPAGQPYVDPGATAVDDIDGDLTDQIVVSGTIDPSRIGTQSVSYRVEDRAGNVSSKVRTVNVGVNSGRGGGGGGLVAPLLLAMLMLFVALHLHLTFNRQIRKVSVLEVGRKQC